MSEDSKNSLQPNNSGNQELASAAENESQLSSLELIKKSLQIHQGPLPSPQTLEEYNRAHPGASELIIKQWVGQTEHRQQLENKEHDSYVKFATNAQNKSSFTANLGLTLAFVIAMTGISGGIYLAAIGMQWAGFGIAGLQTIVGLFIYGSQGKQASSEALLPQETKMQQETDEA